jgi:hypothetical protein
MNDHTPSRITAPYGHQQSVKNDIPCDPGFHGPTDNAPRKQIQNDRYDPKEGRGIAMQEQLPK